VGRTGVMAYNRKDAIMALEPHPKHKKLWARAQSVANSYYRHDPEEARAYALRFFENHGGRWVVPAPKKPARRPARRPSGDRLPVVHSAQPARLEAVPTPLGRAETRVYMLLAALRILLLHHETRNWALACIAGPNDAKSGLRAATGIVGAEHQGIDAFLNRQTQTGKWAEQLSRSIFGCMENHCRAMLPDGCEWAILKLVGEWPECSFEERQDATTRLLQRLLTLAPGSEITTALHNLGEGRGYLRHDVSMDESPLYQPVYTPAYEPVAEPRIERTPVDGMIKFVDGLLGVAAGFGLSRAVRKMLRD